MRFRMEKNETAELLVELAKACVNYKDKQIAKCLDKIMDSELAEKDKDEIRKLQKEKKPIRIVTDFDKRTESKIIKEEYKVACGNNVPVYTITDMRDLMQFVGYCKYTNAENYNVYMRGQISLYGGEMMPALYRGQKNYSSTALNFRKRLNQSIKEIDILSGYDKRIVEPMLQHYGVKTTSIDLVDNVWVALWFGLHCADSVYAGGRENLYYSESKEEYAYIILIASDAVYSIGKGIYEGIDSILVDLRKAVPSYFVRTHAQHALMMKRKERNIDSIDKNDVDLTDLIVGIAKIPVKIGLEWSGNNKLLSVGNLFPSAFFDYGYRKMLDQYPLRDKAQARDWGTVQIVND